MKIIAAIVVGQVEMIVGIHAKFVVVKVTKQGGVYLLAFCLVLCSLPTYVFASGESIANIPKSKEVYTDYDLGGTIEKVVEKGKVIVTWTSFDGMEKYTAINENGNVYFNGKLVNTIRNFSHNYINEKSSLRIAATNWGPWNYFDERINTGGKKAAAIAVFIGTAAPWISVRAISGIAALIASSYNYVTIEGRIRYGDDGTYYYYERYTNIYGNGVDPLFNKDYYDTGKELL